MGLSFHRLLIGSSTARPDISVEEYHRVGIHANHAFSILFATTLTLSRRVSHIWNG